MVHDSQTWFRTDIDPEWCLNFDFDALYNYLSRWVWASWWLPAEANPEKDWETEQIHSSVLASTLPLLIFGEQDDNLRHQANKRGAESAAERAPGASLGPSGIANFLNVTTTTR